MNLEDFLQDFYEILDREAIRHEKWDCLSHLGVFWQCLTLNFHPRPRIFCRNVQFVGTVDGVSAVQTLTFLNTAGLSRENRVGKRVVACSFEYAVFHC